MPKSSKASQQRDLVRGRLVALSCLALTLLFVVSVAHNVTDELRSGVVNAPNSYAAIFAVVAAAVSYWWEQRIRILVAFSLGLLLASYVIWQFGLH